MPTQKTFKKRVRVRMAKTGEAYTAARSTLLRRTGPMAGASPVEPKTSSAETDPELPTSDDSVRRATGRGWQEWFTMLDAWGAVDRRHPEIARWVAAEHAVNGWWAQSVTVAYERARGMRAIHQMAAGFSVSATRTIKVDAQQALEAFTDPSVRRRWLPDAPMRRRATRATTTARFDRAEPPSRVVVTVVPKGRTRTTVAVSHERLPDGITAERVKAEWRDRLARLRETLERPEPRPPAGHPDGSDPP